MKSYSPLRYPGGKAKLAAFIKLIFQKNNLNDGTYIEPYAGGAGVALALLLEGYAWSIIINDIDNRVYAFWYSILMETEKFCQKIVDTPVTLEEWHKQKTLHKHCDSESLFNIGFATFFLNRTNRSGILDGGAIGGKLQNGPYKIDARYNKQDLCKRIELIAKYKSRIQVFNEDAQLLVQKLSQTIRGKCLFYFDPPYYKKGYLLYKNCYIHDDHVNLAKTITEIQHPWIVTYDNVDEIRKIYQLENAIPFDIAYSANKLRTRGQEVFFHSKNIKIPVNPFTRQQDFDQKLA